MGSQLGTIRFAVHRKTLYDPPEYYYADFETLTNEPPIQPLTEAPLIVDPQKMTAVMIFEDDTDPENCAVLDVKVCNTPNSELDLKEAWLKVRFFQNSRMVYDSLLWVLKSVIHSTELPIAETPTSSATWSSYKVVIVSLGASILIVVTFICIRKYCRCNRVSAWCRSMKRRRNYQRLQGQNHSEEEGRNHASSGEWNFTTISHT